MAPIPRWSARAIRVDGEPSQVVGIAPAWMDRAGSPDLWMPARFNEAVPPAGSFGWNGVGRLKPGVRPDQAATHLEPLVQRAMSDYIDSENYRAFLTEGRYRPVVHAMKEDVVGSLHEPLWILLGTVGMVLLVACGNVANLCLVRAESRQRELAIRAALGSSRGRRAVLANAAAITGVGLVVGAIGAAGLTRFLGDLLYETEPLDVATFAGMSALLFATGLVAAYLPARRAASVSPMEAMRS